MKVKELKDKLSMFDDEEELNVHVTDNRPRKGLGLHDADYFVRLETTNVIFAGFWCGPWKPEDC